MKRRHLSKNSIDIDAPIAKVWEALVTAEIAKKYFFGAEIITDWKAGSSILFQGELNGNKYEEKGILVNVIPNIQLQYTHWSNFDGVSDTPENYRIWTFDLVRHENYTKLSISEDNIPDEKKRERSDEFWKGVLLTIKQLLEAV